jgi:hypothetical protein
MTGSGGDLWRQLGIAPTTDEGAIRRAYAKRLREVRPDDDPIGFQHLVEARDLALRLARRDQEDLPWEPLHGEQDTVSQGPLHIAKIHPGPPPQTIEWTEPVIDRPLESDGSGLDRGEWGSVLDLLDIVLREAGDTSDPPAWLNHSSSSRPVAPPPPAGASWREIGERIVGLSMADRTAIQPGLIQRLSAYVTMQDAAFTDWHVLNGYPVDRARKFVEWPPAAWPFFDLVAELDVEFGWRESDRIIHLCIGRSEAARFLSLLNWAADVADAGPRGVAAHGEGGPRRIRAVDLYAFYDGGRDRLGLRAWRIMRDNPRIWQEGDAATNLFFPLRPLREGRYLRALLGLLGWTGLIAAYAPWRISGVAHTLPWIVPEAGSIVEFLLDLWPACLGVWMAVRLDDLTLRKRYSFFGPAPPKVAQRPSDLGAMLFFPFWALARGFELRGIIGLIAWGAVLHQITTASAGFFAEFHTRPGPLMLAVALHVAAGTHGQRWVGDMLLRVVAAADRAGPADPAQRWLFIWRRRTADPDMFGKLRKALKVLWYLMLALVIAYMAFGLLFLEKHGP